MIIQQVIPKENFILCIVTENGRSGEFDVSPYLKGEAFEALKNPEEFKKIHNGKYWFFRVSRGRPQHIVC
ncbi:DUF2442 domain-containing protein [Methylomarinum sp. Ch1-1]|uniref:DUF2442 domain-containing protein n=1 Tax=Methylomarinum roseum TaxID=3067653 RepID=A0AAU7NS89_9GAMM|nr:DUF2442 domain-containing protein [Methylomarinum sp. Ch1-1]MDP4520157.1 DUF2442 domain-containing protein [Methylomarinum sp. Ch1-1]